MLDLQQLQLTVVWCHACMSGKGAPAGPREPITSDFLWQETKQDDESIA